jgi:hypothetical protein
MDKNFLIGAILVVLISVAISFPVAQTSKDNSQLTFHSAVCVYKNGQSIGYCTHNMMMNAGLNWTRDLIGNASAAGPMAVIALGNGSTAETNTLTSLPSNITECGLQNATGAYAIVGTGNWSISKTFTSSCNNEIVNTTALFNSSSSPNAMFAGKNFSSSVTLQSGDQLSVTWYIWVT